jgi:hypothetical protein
VKQGYQQLLAEESEYKNSTQQHLDKTITQLLETLSFGYLKARLKNEDAISVIDDLYNLKKNVDAGGAGNTREQAEILIEQIIGKIADKRGVGELPAIVDTVFDFLYLHEDLKQRQNLNLKSVDRIIYSVFYSFNLEWKTRTLEVLHKLLDITRSINH